MTQPCPRILIGGTHSGVGKTSLTLGLARVLVRHGLRVQTFKVGPDFLDPSYLAAASGRTCYNLDGWMTDRAYVEQLFARATEGADIAIIEGVMGLFDGASPTTLEGSSAEIASWLDSPVLLVVSARGAARSLAATVKGFAEFEPGVCVAGVIANLAGSDRHKAWLSESLQAAKLPPLLAAVPRGALPALASRHLGLMTADSTALPDSTIESLADACEAHVDMPALLEIARRGGSRGGDVSPAENQAPVAIPRGQTVRIGIARDEAFHFYYPDNLEMLAARGAELVNFSPLHDAHLPGGLDGLYLGGGYPEVHADGLSANATMLDDICHFAASDRCIYAECGGLMYLGRCLRTLDGRSTTLAGVLPIETEMLDRLQSLGYVRAALAADGPLGRAGQCLRGHEFHYSRLCRDDSAGEGWRPAYELRRRRGEAVESAGLAKGKVLASYVHVHFASNPAAADALIACCKGVA